MKQPDQREAEAVAADPWMTPERISLRNLAMSFTQKEIVPHLQDWEDAGELPRELHRRAAAWCLPLASARMRMSGCQWISRSILMTQSPRLIACPIRFLDRRERVNPTTRSQCARSRVESLPQSHHV